MKKFLAEFIGTMTLVILGCGSAMLVGCDSVLGCGYLLTAFAFGLAIITMAYSIGNISGCHVNPAVSLAVMINGGLKKAEFVQYVVAQVMGAFFGSGILYLIFSASGLSDMTGALGTNSTAGVGGISSCAIAVELVLTFVFVLAVLGATDKNAGHGSLAGITIGLSLSGVHILGIALTGTSVNPARSIGPAIVAAISGNTAPIGEVWIFILGPIIGAAMAAIAYRIMRASDSE